MLAGVFLAAGEGETALIAYSEQGSIAWARAPKGDKENKFLLRFFIGSPFKRVFINASLSLPAAYLQPRQHQDYYFRQADKALKLPSPMANGLQTALAMRFRFMLESQGIRVQETAPLAQAARLQATLAGYRQGSKPDPIWLGLLQQAWPGPDPMPGAAESWAEFDTMLVLLAGQRHLAGQSSTFGNEKEGFIII